jgi:MFS family permease
MTDAVTAQGGRMAGAPGLLDRERIIARAGFNRWLVPPAAVAVHLCIGMAYGLSVYWLPLSRALGGSHALACPAGSGLFDILFTRSCDWPVTYLLFTFTLAIVILGASAALWGGWLERVGPRKAGMVAALCWGGGYLVAALGVVTHQLWLIWLGLGVIGGIGLGLGYISPVSTLIKWFPDRRGMATGMAIMGFGGGAMIGAPLANHLMAAFDPAGAHNVALTFLITGILYFVVISIGAFGYRLPPEGWQPEGWTPPASATRPMVTQGHVHLRMAPRTLQFWLIWAVLCLNVSAGIGVLAMASPMLQEIFAGKLIGAPDVGFTALDAKQRAAVAAIAAGFTGLLSLFNIAGRFFWASLSDHIGRKNTYTTFFILGMIVYAGASFAAQGGSKALFVLCLCIALSMYGGGFATVPAYLADIFGTKFVGAIHGLLLTAWSTAGVIGPLLVGFIRDSQIAAGVPRAAVYNRTLLILAGLLFLGLIANLLVRPLSAKWFMREEEIVPQGGKSASVTAAVMSGGASYGISRGGFTLGALLAWLSIGIPIAWGVYQTLKSVVLMFR